MHINAILPALVLHRTSAMRRPRWAWLRVAAAAAIVLAAAASTPPAHALWLLLEAPLVEEIVFRAGLQETLLRRCDSALLANVVTAFTFAAAHVAVRADVQAALTLLPALAIGLLYQRQRRLAPCIALHALFNAVWLLAA